MEVNSEMLDALKKEIMSKETECNVLNQQLVGFSQESYSEYIGDKELLFNEREMLERKNQELANEVASYSMKDLEASMNVNANVINNQLNCLRDEMDKFSKELIAGRAVYTQVKSYVENNRRLCAKLASESLVVMHDYNDLKSQLNILAKRYQQAIQENKNDELENMKSQLSVYNNNITAYYSIYMEIDKYTTANATEYTRLLSEQTQNTRKLRDVSSQIIALSNTKPAAISFILPITGSYAGSTLLHKSSTIVLMISPPTTRAIATSMNSASVVEK
jgi:hypothetical protein